MAIKEKKRTLRPSTRKENSPYKIDTSNVYSGDTLIINIDEEDNPGKVLFRYKVDGDMVDARNSIHFKAIRKEDSWKIVWSGVTPKEI